MNCASSCLSWQGASNGIHDDLQRSTWKFDLRSRSSGDPSRSCCILGDASRRYRHIAVGFTSPSWLYRELLPNKWWWPLMTSNDPRGVTHKNWHSDRQKYPKITSYRSNWTNILHILEKGSIWIFPHWLIMGRSRNWPDLRSPIWKFRDKQVVGTYALMTPCKYETDQ